MASLTNGFYSGYSTSVIISEDMRYVRISGSNFTFTNRDNSKLKSGHYTISGMSRYNDGRGGNLIMEQGRISVTFGGQTQEWVITTWRTPSGRGEGFILSQSTDPFAKKIEYTYMGTTM